MIDYTLLAVLVAGFYVGWNTGSNDAANAMGVSVGGRVISYRSAITLMILFVLLGAVLEGWKVMETVGSEIVVSPEVENPLTEVPKLAVIALFSAGAWVSVASTLRLPVSTSQSIVGSVIGAGLLLSFLNLPAAPSTSVRFGILRNIGLAWILTPISAAAFALIIHQFVGSRLRRVSSAFTLNRILGGLVVSTGAFAAYSLGTNTVGNATAMIYAITGGTHGDVGWTPQLIGLFGGIALAVGALTYSRRVMETVGMGIIRLDAMMAFSAQLGAAFTIWIFTQVGLPVSSTQAIVGGVAGSGLVKGTATVSKNKLGEIGLGWVLTPIVAAILSFGLGWLFMGM